MMERCTGTKLRVKQSWLVLVLLVTVLAYVKTINSSEKMPYTFTGNTEIFRLQVMLRYEYWPLSFKETGQLIYNRD